jgi:hypothetical protein
MNGIYRLRCTRIDVSRYALGPVRAGQEIDIVREYFAEQRNRLLQRFFGPPSRRLNWSNIPPGIRYAIGRLSISRWNWNACIGNPVGSLFIGKQGKSCGGLRFRELLTRSDTANPGPPVPLFPSCAALDDLFSPQPHCIP